MAKTPVIIDATTGTVFLTDNLYYAELTEEQLKEAESSDSSAFDIAMGVGAVLDPEAIKSLAIRVSG